jgi:iron complex transport system substrate-binding protein
LLIAPAGAAGAAPRVVSFDQCSDQYVLALSPRSAIAGLSTRADDADSPLAARARGLPLRRVTLETALAARPELVVRVYGGDARLVQAMERRGVPVLTLDDASDFEGVRRNLRRVGRATGEQAAAEALIADMDRRLARSAGAWKGARAIYLTPGGYTAGPGTLADAILRAAGLVNATTRPGYTEAPLERLTLDPPAAVVTAFFDTRGQGAANWSPARHEVMQRLLRERAVANLPGRLIACANWSAAQAVERLASKAPR